MFEKLKVGIIHILLIFQKEVLFCWVFYAGDVWLNFSTWTKFKDIFE